MAGGASLDHFHPVARHSHHRTNEIESCNEIFEFALKDGVDGGMVPVPCERAAKMIAFTRPPMSNQSVVSCDDVIFLPVCFVAAGWDGYYDGGKKVLRQLQD